MYIVIKDTVNIPYTYGKACKNKDPKNKCNDTMYNYNARNSVEKTTEIKQQICFVI